jgi:transcriptional regulator with XRE-family HTH domain
MAKRRDTLLIGGVLRDARLKAGMTQEALAFAADVDRTYVSYLENDQKSPTIEMLGKLCIELKLPVSELIKRAEKTAIR